jgi:flagellar hook-basal body protein
MIDGTLTFDDLDGGAFIEGIGTYRDLRGGQMIKTDAPLDIAIHGNAYFVVDTPVGQRFTRDGNFRLDGQGRIVNAEGFPLLQAIWTKKLTPAQAAEAYAKDVLSLEQIRRLLGLTSRWEAQDVLCSHGVWPGQSADEVVQDADTSARFRATLS